MVLKWCVLSHGGGDVEMTDACVGINRRVSGVRVYTFQGMCGNDVGLNEIPGLRFATPVPTEVSCLPLANVYTTFKRVRSLSVTKAKTK